MVERYIAARGVRDKLVLDAMRKVPRELFLPKELREFAYEDAPLPIAGKQTISQPYIVAFMVESLILKGGEKVLEIGAGSGYAAAVLSEIAADVYTVERLGPLAEGAAALLAELGYDNVHVLHGDGTKGWPEHAPYDAIVVSAGAPQVPESLKEQLKIGGRLVIPIGADQHSQELVRIIRVSANEYRSEHIADVRFVPLIGEEGWTAVRGDDRTHARRARLPASSDDEILIRKLSDEAEPFSSIEAADRNPLMERIGSARLGERPERLRNSTKCVSASRQEDRMNNVKIPHNALVFVGDGRKALFLRNDGDALTPHLRSEKVFEEENPSTHEQGSDRPGRVTTAGLEGRRSAVEPTDWHDIEEHRFAQRVATAIEDLVRTSKAKVLIVVAPPRTLADLRNAFHPDVKGCIIAEINKDLTKHSIREIEKHLMSGA